MQLFKPSQQHGMRHLQRPTSLSQQEQSPCPCKFPALCVSNAKQDTTLCIHFTRQVTVAQHRLYRLHELSCEDGAGDCARVSRSCLEEEAGSGDTDAMTALTHATCLHLTLSLSDKPRAMGLVGSGSNSIAIRVDSEPLGNYRCRNVRASSWLLLTSVFCSFRHTLLEQATWVYFTLTRKSCRSGMLQSRIQ